GLLNANGICVSSLPNKSNVCTLLRSPHTDKKSREQFRKRSFKKLISLSMSRSFLYFLMKKEFITSKVRSDSFLGA
ncbi:MAG: 30S ribosomal protein S10, partial [Bacteroidia bacterium]